MSIRQKAFSARGSQDDLRRMRLQGTRLTRGIYHAIVLHVVSCPEAPLHDPKGRANLMASCTT